MQKISRLRQYLDRYRCLVPFSLARDEPEEDYLKHDEVVIERDKAAEERDGDEPEQSLIIGGTQCDAEQIEFAEEPGQRRQTGQGQHENSHAPGEQR